MIRDGVGFYENIIKEFSQSFDNLKYIFGGESMKKVKESDSIATFLGANTTIEGAVNFDGAIRVDGRVNGKINSREGTLIIGEKAVIDADVSVAVAIVRGRVNGIIKAGSRIEVYPPARIEGDIQAPVISIDAGVKFNGCCVMKSGEAPLSGMENGDSSGSGDNNDKV